MNTPLDHEPEDLRYAEYVLGVLDADTREAVEREIASDPHAAEEVARWQRCLLPLAEDIPVATPSAHVWARIERTLGMQTARRESTQPARAGWWSNLALWRGFAFGAAAVAAAFIVAFIVVPRTTMAPPAAPGTAYMASTITQTDGQVGWTATMDLAHARMVIVPAKPQSLPADRAPELWLIPAGQKPIAVGMIAASGPTTIALSKALVESR
ncbi:MAG: anti-sigma factor, partial [Rhodanobacteraceae bacterium]